MLTPYFGEFMIIPMPLEFSFNPCSNGCVYCFSNLNNYKNKTSEQSFFNKLKTFREKTDTVSMLLKNGYPICISNRTDPFAKTNYKFTIKAAETLTSLGIPIAWQTKGGKGIDEVLSFAEPALWYVTVTHDNEETRNRIEHGCTTISERLALIEKLVSNGHQVNVGINPFVPEWIKDKKAIVKALKDAGCYGVTVEGMHFSSEQIKRMPEKSREALGSEIIARAKKKTAVGFELDQYHELCGIIKDSGMDVWSFWNMEPSDLWGPYYEKYKCFPIITNFTNWAFRNKKDGDTITYTEFKNAVGGDPPKYKYKIDSYVISVARNLFRDSKIPTYGHFENLLKIVWNETRMKACPAHHPSFSIVVNGPKSDLRYVLGNDGHPVMMLNRAGFESYYVREDGKGVR